MREWGLFVAGSVVVAAVLAGGQSPAKTKPKPTPPKPPVSFSREVLPILSDKCFLCHGPDAGSRMANLRLDTREDAVASRGGRPGIVPGKPSQSLILQRINHATNPMPPRSTGKSLTRAEIETLRRWIAEGANYTQLWSFEALPKSVPVPNTKGPWARQPLDHFILAKLRESGLEPTKAADRPRWLRRVTFDLTGLPPTEAEIDAFLADRSPRAYEVVVDRLLASPHFGERMAVEWLDAARYSDSYGYQSDLLSPTWPYRDWVVRAFNRNLPYDQFLTEQLAGDLLPNATRDQRLATAFNRLHRQSNEGGSIALEFKTEYAADRTETFSTAVLGLTVGCARCHDHKYDPIKQREYYQLFAYFNNIDEYGLLLSSEIVPTPSLLLPKPDQEPMLVKLREAAKAAQQAANISGPGAGPSSPLLAQFSLDEASNYANAVPGSKATAAPLGSVRRVPGVRGSAVELDGENGLVLKGLPGRERWEPFTWSFWVRDPGVAAPVVLLHRTGGTDVGFCGLDLSIESGYLTARVMRQWPGNALAVRAKTRIPSGQWTHVAWSYDGSGRAAGLRLYLHGKPIETVVLQDELWKKIAVYGDHGPSGGEWSFGQRFRDLGFKGGQLDEVAFAGAELTSAEVYALMQGRPAPNAGWNLALAEAKARVRAAQEQLANFEEGIFEISVMQEARTTVPAYLLARGEYDAPRNEKTRVRRGVPAALPKLLPHPPADRRELAQWATYADHPLTARVAVNRLWQMIFGTGLVESSENFGTQGQQPSHPELLDYLARDFVNRDWDVKSMLRTLVLSATYRQDSTRSARGQRLDPENRLLWRGPSHRLSAEMVRDSVLAASDLLQRGVGGPPVNPYQPAGIWQENNAFSPGFTQSKGPDLYRRSLYSTWKRTTPVPSMLMFDATSREACNVRRPSTSTPLQALVLLNDVQFVEAARVLADRVLKQPGTDDARLTAAFRRLAGRAPTGRESAVLRQTLAEQRAIFRDPAEAAKLLRVGEAPASPELPPAELAAMTVTVQVILNSDAMVWKR